MFNSFSSSFAFGRHTPSVVVAADKSWTGVTSGLQLNLLNAPITKTWTDISGNGRNATLQGATTYVSTNGGGIKLNNSTYGGTDYVSVPYNISSSTVTVEMVASFNPTSTWATVWGNDAYNSSAGYYAYMYSSTAMTWGKVPGNISSSITASNNIRHYVWVINGTSYSFYINGTQVGTTTVSSPAQTLFTTNNFFFGARHGNDGTGASDKMNNSNASLQPVFYQLRVYNTALSSSDITTNYNAVKGSVTGGYGLP